MTIATHLAAPRPPTISWAGLRQRLLGAPVEEANVARRGFRVSDADARRRIEHVGSTFLFGYNTGLTADSPETLATQLEAAVAPESRGFAYEGGAMALSLRDQLTPWRGSLLTSYVHGPASAHLYMAHIGVGMALARMPWRLNAVLAKLSPLYGWLAMDGYGFHHGFFGWPRYVEQQAIPKRLNGYQLRVFDQGLGRSLWFVDGADAARIRTTISAFAHQRHSDLWSGVGLASAYAGGVSREALESLQTAAGPHRSQLALGAALAALTRHKAGNLAPHTDLACQVYCGVTAEIAGTRSAELIEDLPPDGPQPLYALVRDRLYTTFGKGTVAA